MQQNYIPVLTKTGRPLAPCHPKRAKTLVKKGKAHFQHRYGIRCIVLHNTQVPKVKNSSKVELRIDPGSQTTGIAITRNHEDNSREALIGIELHHQGRAITKRLIKRRQLRRNRRYRKTRYRKPRFSNRTRPEGWLPPSILSRLQNTLTWTGRLSKLLPITGIHVETNVFDPQLLRNPEIQGVQYQLGPLYQTNLRAAVLHRDNNRCAYCDRSGRNSKLELEHVIPRSDGGQDRYGNLVASCPECNRKKGSQPLEQFLQRRPAKIGRIQAKLGQDLADATHMNLILPRLINTLRNQGWTVTKHSAATTAAGRQTCGVEKSHHADAALTGCPERLRYLPEAPITITATGRGTRQRMMPDRFGTPRGQGYRDYCKLPRHIRKITPTPSHKKRQKRVGNIATGDYVIFLHQGTQVQGYGAISHQSVALTKPRWRSTKAENATVLERNHGYQLATPNESN